jgi:hypothetical protein
MEILFIKCTFCPHWKILNSIIMIKFLGTWYHRSKNSTFHSIFFMIRIRTQTHSYHDIILKWKSFIEWFFYIHIFQCGFCFSSKKAINQRNLPYQWCKMRIFQCHPGEFECFFFHLTNILYIMKTQIEVNEKKIAINYFIIHDSLVLITREECGFRETETVLEIKRKSDRSKCKMYISKMRMIHYDAIFPYLFFLFHSSFLVLNKIAICSLYVHVHFHLTI